MSATSKTGHRFEDALGYVQDFLSPEEKAEFEAHLAACAECQASVDFARKFVPALNQALLAPSTLTDAQLLANVRAEHARRMEAKVSSTWLAKLWKTLAVVGVAVVLFVVVDLLAENRPGHLYAPTHDAGGKPSDAGK